MLYETGVTIDRFLAFPAKLIKIIDFLRDRNFISITLLRKF